MEVVGVFLDVVNVPVPLPVQLLLRKLLRTPKIRVAVTARSPPRSQPDPARLLLSAYRVSTVHRPIVEGEEADQLLQKPSAADVRELNSAAQHLQCRKPQMVSVTTQGQQVRATRTAFKYQGRTGSSVAGRHSPDSQV